MKNPGGVPRFLEIHVEVDEVEKNLDVGLGLGGASHDPEAHVGLSVPGDEGGDDGVKGTLPRGVRVEVTLFEGEQLPSVLETEPEAVGAETRAHAPVVALDQGHHVAVGVGHGEIDGVALLQGGVPRLVAPGRATGIDELSSLRGVGFGDQLGHGDGVEVRVGVELRPVLEGQLLRLQEPVNMLHAPETGPPQIEPLQDVEDLKRSDPLAVGRQLPQLVSAIRGGNGLHPLRPVGGQVLVGQEPTGLLHEGVDGAGDLTLVESVPAVGGQGLEGAGKGRVLPDLSLLRGLSVLEEGLGEPRDTSRVAERSGSSSRRSTPRRGSPPSRSGWRGRGRPSWEACRNDGEARTIRPHNRERSREGDRRGGTLSRPRFLNSSRVRLMGERPLAFSP